MLGWAVFVHRVANPDSNDLIVHWQTGVFGLEWLDQLVKDGKAQDLGGNGYPDRYTVTAGILFPLIATGLPAHSSPLVIGDDYVLPQGWNGSIVWKQDPARCKPDDVLFLEAWDQS